MEPAKRSANRELTRQDLPGLLGGLAVAVAYIVLTALGHPFYAATVAGGAIAFVFWSMPRENREAVVRDIERRERTPIGRITTAMEFVGGLILLYFIAKALLTGW